MDKGNRTDKKTENMHRGVYRIKLQQQKEAAKLAAESEKKLKEEKSFLKKFFAERKNKEKAKNYFIVNEEESKKSNSFAGGLNFYKLFCVFFIGCFIGVVVEVIFCFAVEQKFESRQGLI